MGLDEQLWGAFLDRKVTAGDATPATGSVEPRDPYQNQLERDYAAHLELRRKAGDVLRVSYEGVRLRIGWRRTKSGKLVARYYTPDFHVQLADGSIQLHEAKGFMREAAAVRLSACAELFPYPIFVVRRDGDGWTLSQV